MSNLITGATNMLKIAISNVELDYIKGLYKKRIFIEKNEQSRKVNIQPWEDDAF